MKPKNEKQTAILAWSVAIKGERLTPLLCFIGRTIQDSEHKAHTFIYAHSLGRASRHIAKPDDSSHIGIAALGYHAKWSGKWHVTNHDCAVWSTFRMWLARYLPSEEGNASILTGRISTALNRMRMFQAYQRYQKTGLRKEHCELLSHMLWEMDTERGDWISIYVQGKRPMGDSSREDCISMHCGWPRPWNKEDRSLTEREKERAWDIFDELVFAATDAAKLALKKIKKLA